MAAITVSCSTASSSSRSTPASAAACSSNIKLITAAANFSPNSPPPPPGMPPADDDDNPGANDADDDEEEDEEETLAASGGCGESVDGASVESSGDCYCIQCCLHFDSSKEHVCKSDSNHDDEEDTLLPLLPPLAPTPSDSVSPPIMQQQDNREPAQPTHVSATHHQKLTLPPPPPPQQQVSETSTPTSLASTSSKSPGSMELTKAQELVLKQQLELLTAIRNNPSLDLTSLGDSLFGTTPPSPVQAMLAQAALAATTATHAKSFNCQQEVSDKVLAPPRAKIPKLSNSEASPQLLLNGMSSPPSSTAAANAAANAAASAAAAAAALNGFLPFNNTSAAAAMDSFKSFLPAIMQLQQQEQQKLQQQQLQQQQLKQQQQLEKQLAERKERENLLQQMQQEQQSQQQYVLQQLQLTLLLHQQQQLQQQKTLQNETAQQSASQIQIQQLLQKHLPPSLPQQQQQTQQHSTQQQQSTQQQNEKKSEPKDNNVSASARLMLHQNGLVEQRASTPVAQQNGSATGSTVSTEHPGLSSALQGFGSSANLLSAAQIEQQLLGIPGDFPRVPCPVCGKMVGKLGPHMRVHKHDAPFIMQQEHLPTTAPVPTTAPQVQQHAAEQSEYNNGSAASLDHKTLQSYLGSNYSSMSSLRCEECDKSFSSKAALAYHIRLHRGEKPFRCHLCPKAFTSKSNLNSHLRTHAQTRAYQCNLCGRGFSQSPALRSHLKSQHGTDPLDKPWGCDRCGRRFAQQHALLYHERAHMGVKPFKCEHCERAFTSKSNLNSHVRHRHSDDDEAADEVSSNGASSCPVAATGASHTATSDHREVVDHAVVVADFQQPEQQLHVHGTTFGK